MCKWVALLQWYFPAEIAMEKTQFKLKTKKQQRVLKNCRGLSPNYALSVNIAHFISQDGLFMRGKQYSVLYKGVKKKLVAVDFSLGPMPPPLQTPPPPPATAHVTKKLTPAY